MDANNNLEIQLVLAHHEAGHAVAAWKLRFRTMKLWVNCRSGGQQDNFSPRPIDPEMMSDGDWRWVRQKTMILLCGEIAERYLDPEADEFASVDVWAEIRELLNGVFGDGTWESSVWFADVRSATPALIADNWSSVTALANALNAGGEMGEDNVAEILNSSI
jgi:hypothetical protein